MVHVIKPSRRGRILTSTGVKSSVKFFAVLCIAILLDQSCISAQELETVAKPQHLVSFSSAQIGNSGQIFSVARSEAGIVYLAAPDDSCVFEFDGRTWTPHRLESAPLCVTCDDQNRIWVGTDDGAYLGQYDQLGSLKFVRLEIPFKEDDNRALWECSANEKGVVFFNPGLVVRTKAGESSIVRFEEHERVFHVETDLMLTVDQNKKQLVIHRPNETSYINDFDGVGAVPLGNGKFLELDGNNRLWLHANGNRRRFSKELDELIGQREIFYFEVIGNGNVAVGTTDGFFECTTDGDLVLMLGVDDGLSDGFIYRAVSDFDDNIWMIDGYGLAVVMPDDSKQQFRFTDRSAEVLDFEQIDNRIYVATARGCNLLFLDNSSTQSNYLELQEFAGMYVSDLCRFGDKLIAVTNSGLFELDGQSVKRVLTGEFCITCRFQNTNAFAVVDNYNRVFSATIENDSWEMGDSIQCPFEISELHAIGNSSIALIGYNEEFALLCWQEGEKKLQLQTKKLPGLHCYGSATLDDRKLFFMSDGLMYQVGSFPNPTLIPAAASNVSNAINHLLQDHNYYTFFRIDESRFVFCGSKSIDVFSLENATNPNHVGGWNLAKRLALPPRITTDSKHHLLGVVDDKLLQFDLLQVPGHSPLRSPIVKASAEGSVKRDDDSAVTLKSKNEIKFVFSEPFGYYKSNEVEYQFRLNGFDDDWSDWAKDGQKEYMNLPGGKYEFQVRSRISANQTSVPASFSFVVLRPWYFSVWFIIVSVFLISGLGFGIEKIRAKLVRGFQGRMDRLLKERMPELEQQKKQIEEQRNLLVQQSKEHEADKTESLDAIMGAMAHDFNNLLSVIRTYGDILTMSENQKVNSSAVKILNATESAAELCKQMQILSGGLPLEHELVNLQQLAAETADVVRPILRTNIRLQCRLADRDDENLDSFISGNRSELKQIVINLLVNANEAADSCIRLTTGRSRFSKNQLASGRWVGRPPKAGEFDWVEVVDDGPGVDDSIENRMFDPFFSSKGIGRGLGLAIVDRIVERHNGVIFVQSSGEDENLSGASFKVCFPQARKKPADVQQSSNSTSSYEIRPLNVLVVDDDYAVLDSLEALLDVMGHKPIVVSSGHEALDIVNEKEFDFAFIDLMMPGTMGDEIARQINDMCPQLHIALMSGFSKTQIDSDLLSQPTVTFVEKPIGIETIKSLLDKVLSSSCKN